MKYFLQTIAFLWPLKNLYYGRLKPVLSVYEARIFANKPSVERAFCDISKI